MNVLEIIFLNSRKEGKTKEVKMEYLLDIEELTFLIRKNQLSKGLYNIGL